MCPLSSRPARTLLALLLSAAFLSGCNSQPKRVTVKGSVKYNDKLVKAEGVRVSFVGSDGVPVTADVDPNGEYSASGVLPGENHILVSWVIPATEVKPGKPKGGVSGPPLPTSKAPIPAKYARPEESDLKFTVEPDKDNVYNIDLQ